MVPGIQMALEENTWEGETFESLKTAKNLPCAECSESDGCVSKLSVTTGRRDSQRPSAGAEVCEGALPSGKR